MMRAAVMTVAAKITLEAATDSKDCSRISNIMKHQQEWIAALRRTAEQPTW